MRIFILIVFCFSSLKTSAQKSSKVGTNYNDIIICELPIPAEFPGGSKAWARYLQKNTNSELGNKYITIPKGKKSAKASLRVCFVISK